MDAAVSAPVTLKKLGAKDNPTLLAIYAQPDAHRYQYLSVVYPPNRVGAGSGMAQDGQVDFSPPRSPNVTKGRARFLFDVSIGTWAMEVLHIATGIGDYLQRRQAPGTLRRDGRRRGHSSIVVHEVAGGVARQGGGSDARRRHPEVVHIARRRATATATRRACCRSTGPDSRIPALSHRRGSPEE